MTFLIREGVNDPVAQIPQSTNPNPTEVEAQGIYLTSTFKTTGRYESNSMKRALGYCKNVPPLSLLGSITDNNVK